MADIDPPLWRGWEFHEVSTYYRIPPRELAAWSAAEVYEACYQVRMRALLRPYGGE